MMLEKTFTPQGLEERIYKKWEEGDFFSCDISSPKKTFCIMMPPPNVTGTLHLGHALNYTLQDILVRYKRMKGFDVLWQPGTDHAGIATQALVERQLDAKKISRHELGREKFLEHVWAWKKESGDIIVNQQRRMGLSPDWKRQRFTMDDGLCHAVRKVFVQLYRENLIYRDKRLVNWDPKLLTAVSDLEVLSVESKGHYWYFRYPVEGMPGMFLTVATSRPETMFGDTAVAVHPDDARYQHLIGKFVILPLMGRRIPVIADTCADPEKGSGAVKITPAHDFNDFETGLRHKLPQINVLTADARLNENAPEEWQGLDRFEARKKAVAEMERLGLLEKIEEATIMLPYGDRSGTVIEPWLTDQWFMRADVLAKPALEAVEKGETLILPESSRSVYCHWLKNIQPWCISRQLWWGHRIPAWYGPEGSIFVADTQAEAHELAKEKFGYEVELNQDDDVLDTWFSSGLWPFSTLGWPDKTPELDRYYPSSVLVTGSDIIFFWVVRMMMLGIKFMGKPPFSTVYLHALVRDEKGQKMSKSKGNIINPLDIVDEFGADALRFTMALLASPGRDIRFSRNLVEGSRNFATKIWNAARFLEHYKCVYPENLDPNDISQSCNRWIISELECIANQVASALDNNSFDVASNALYHFVWGKFCDWYLEMIKPVLSGQECEEKTETSGVVAWVFGQICRLLHPFMPFLTEELWDHFAPGRGLLIVSQWPEFNKKNLDDGAREEINWMISLISAIRALRNDFSISPSLHLNLCFGEGKPLHRDFLLRHSSMLAKMARIQEIHHDSAASQSSGMAQIVVEGTTLMIPLGDVLDLDAERQRLQKKLLGAEEEIKSIEAKLGNYEFTSKAPAAIIEKNQSRLSEALEDRDKLAKALARIACD